MWERLNWKTCGHHSALSDCTLWRNGMFHLQNFHLALRGNICQYCIKRYMETAHQIHDFSTKCNESV